MTAGEGEEQKEDKRGWRNRRRKNEWKRRRRMR
jgi:hypothetical protein